MISIKNITFMLILAIVVPALFSAKVHALDWPGTKWGGGQSVSIKLSNSPPKHVDMAMAFAVYLPGDTRGQSGTFDIQLIDVNCNPNNLSYTVWRIKADDSLGNTTDKSCDGDRSISIAYDIGAYKGGNLQQTQYRLAITAFSMKDQETMKFKIRADNAAQIGFVGTRNTTILAFFKSVPIAIDGENKNNWHTLNIPIARDCNDGTADNDTFEFYDFDNYGWRNPNGAQDNGLWNWNGTNNGAGVPEPGFNFIPLKVSLNKNWESEYKAAVNKSTNDKGTNTVGWDVDNKIFRPKSFANGDIYDSGDDSNSNENGFIVYNIFQNDVGYTLTLHNLNADNYFSLSSSIDEVAPCGEPRVWNIELSPNRDRTVFQGSTASFTHSVKNVGPDALDRIVDVDVKGVGGNNDWTNYDMPANTPSGSIKTTGQGGIPARSKVMDTIGPDFCDKIKATPVSSTTGGSAETSDCVDVIDPEAIVPTAVSYEKGSSSLSVTGSDVKVSDGGQCPTAAIWIPYKWSIGAFSDTSGFWYGGGTCDPPENIIPILPALKDQLNKLPPGLSGIKYCLNVNNEGDKCGEITVIEVPFARFYGNDIYAFINGDGEIRFNDATKDADTPPYDSRGSVTEYAALAFGTVKIDTSAFRTFDWTKPPNDTDAPGSALLALYPAGKNRIFDDVKAALPDVCPQMDSGGLNAPQNGCYTIQATTSSTPTNLPPPDHKAPAWATQNGGIPVLGWGDTFGAGDTTYNKRVTVYNPSDKMLMIAGNIINGTSFASNPEPEDVGVLLIVSEGPIVIDNNVQLVDAILVSKTGIYTCGIAGFGPLLKKPQNGIHQSCRSTLTINGSVAAPTIDFRRAVGSRYLNPVPDTANGYANCHDFAGIKNCGARGNGINDDWTESPLWSGNFPASNPSGGAAEIVNYPAYLYFAKPFLKDKGVSGGEAAAMFVAPPRQ